MRAVPILEVVQREFKGRFHLHCDIRALISLKIVFLVLLSVFLPSRPHCLAPLKERFTIFLTKREVKKKKKNPNPTTTIDCKIAFTWRHRWSRWRKDIKTRKN